MKMTRKEATDVYQVLSGARLSKLSDEDKFGVIKLMRKLKPVAMSLLDFEAEAKLRLQGDNHESIVKDTRKAQAAGEKSGLSKHRIDALVRYWDDYNARVKACLKEEEEQEVEFDLGPLNDAVVTLLIASNDWVCSEIMKLDVLMTEC